MIPETTTKSRNGSDRLGIQERLHLYFEYFQKSCFEWFDQGHTAFIQRIAQLGSWLILKIFALVGWVVDTDDGQFWRWPYKISKAIVALLLIMVLGSILFVVLAITGTLSGIFGLRNLAEYSLKEQALAWITFFIFVFIAPKIMTEFSLYRLSMIAAYSVAVIGLDIIPHCP